MKFTIENLETKKNACKRKLANEILMGYAYTGQVSNEAYKQIEIASIQKASEIIDNFLSDSLICQEDSIDRKPFGIKYCKENNLPAVILMYKDSAVSWQGVEKIINEKEWIL